MPFGLGMSDRQKATLGAAMTIIAVFVIVCFVAAIFYLLGLFFVRFSNVFLPLATAGVMALVLKPFYEALERRVPKPLALAGVFLSILFPVLAFLGFFGAIAIEQITDAVERAPEWWQSARNAVQERWPRVLAFFEESPWGQVLKDTFEGNREKVVGSLGDVGNQAFSIVGRVFGTVGTVITWAVLPVYLAFFLMADLMRPQHLDGLLPFLKAETRKDVVYLVTEFVNILVAFFRGQIIVAFMQGCLFALGFSLLGLRYGLVLGLTLGFMNIIPYLGSIVGLGIALPLGFFQDGGGWWLVGGVLAVFTIVQMIEGYLLTPKIMGDRTGLHPMAIIVAVFFWGSALGGISGMVLAIPLTAFLVVFWRLARDKYIDELV